MNKTAQNQIEDIKKNGTHRFWKYFLTLLSKTIKNHLYGVPLFFFFGIV
jgi:hypothetical protein